MTAVLLVDDDPRLRSVIGRGLAAEGYEVQMAMDGRSGLKAGLTGKFPLILLDLTLPDIDGLEVCSTLRRRGCASGVLMLTARGALSDKITGLGEGADDYLTKPFEFEELLARMQALMRRGRPLAVENATQTLGDLHLDRAARRAFRGERDLGLTTKEFALLDRLMRSAGSVVSRADLLRDVWNLQIDPGTKVVDVYVRYLRAKVDDERGPSLIQTVRGYGYGVGLQDQGE
jgi:two-component system, OmpR family, response regulator